MANLRKPGEGGGKDGVFINEVEIAKIEQYADSQYPKQMDYKITVLMPKNVDEGADPEFFEKFFFIAGDLYKTGDIPKHIENLLYAVGIGELDDDLCVKLVDDFAISNVTEAVEKLFVGKKIFILSYASGTYEPKDGGAPKPNFRIWNGQGEGFNYCNTFSTETEKSEILKDFEKKCNSKSHPLKFTPEVLEQAKTSSSNSGSKDDGSDDVDQSTMVSPEDMI